MAAARNLSLLSRQFSTSNAATALVRDAISTFSLFFSALGVIFFFYFLVKFLFFSCFQATVRDRIWSFFLLVAVILTVLLSLLKLCKTC